MTGHFLTTNLSHNSSEVTLQMINTTENSSNPLCENNDYCESDEDYFVRLQKYIFPKTGEWFLIILYMFTFFVGLIGNSLVCFAIWRNRNMRTVTNIFIVNLAIADLAVIVVCLPSTLLVDVTNTWFLGTVLCKLNLSLGTLSICVSVLTLSSISVERWYAICHPLRFHSTVRRARTIIIIIWIVSLFVALPEFIFANVVPLRSDTVLLSTCAPTLLKDDFVAVFQICLMVCFYFMPMCLMAFTYAKIALVLWNNNIPGAAEMRSRSEQPIISRQTNENDDRMESRKRVAKMLVAVVVVFGISFFPIHVFNILRYMRKLEGLAGLELFALSAHWLMILNSCINPVIYNFMSDKFRKEFRVAILCCVRCRKKPNSRQNYDRFKVTFNSARTFSSKVHYSNNFSNRTENKMCTENSTVVSINNYYESSN